MSRDPVAGLARRREVLLARSARLRDEIAGDVRAIGAQLGTVDRGVSLARSGLLTPILVAGGAMLLVAGPSRWVRVLGKMIAFWPVVRPLVPRIAAFTRRDGSRPGTRPGSR